MNVDMSSPHIQDIPKRRANLRLLISAAVFGILFAMIFVNQELGLNLTLFFLLIYAYAAFNTKSIFAVPFRREKLLYLFTIPVLFLSLSLFITSSYIHVFSILAIFVVMVVQYTVLSGSAQNQWDEGGFIVDLVMTGINRFLFGVVRFVSDGMSALFKGRKKAGALAGVGMGILLLLIVVPLLVTADANVSNLLGRFIESLALGDIFLYVFMFLLGASLIMGPAATALEPECTGPRQAVYFTKRPIPAVTVGVALTMVAAVYVLFAAVQFSYFFSPKETLAAVFGLTSSAYAVRGFGEMMFMTCFNFVLIVVALRFTHQQDGKTPPYLTALYVLLIAFNFVILASAHMRMSCYVASYGDTVARLLSHSFMLLLVIFNIVMLGRIFSDKVKLIRLFAAAALIYLCTLAAVNPERYVAGENIKRYERTGKIDVEYLLSLPGDALADTCDFLIENPDLLDESTRREAVLRLHMMENRDTGWASLNLADERAEAKLKALLS